jgi:CD109 antigen
MTASSSVTVYERDINRDYSSDILSDVVIPLLPFCACELTAADKQELLNQTLVRSEFSDSFLFEQMSTGSDSTTVFKTRVPETVTSWRLSGFSMNPTKGLGILAKPITFTTFKPFFVDVKLPEEAKVDEPMDCQVAVHNYLDTPTMVDVVMDDPDNNFEVIPVARDGTDKKRKMIQVPANSCKSANFKVMPKKKGKCPVKIRAVSPIGCDANKKELMVQPAGITITETMSQAVLVEPGNTTVSQNFPVEIPENAVPESVKMQLSVQGDKSSLDLSNIPSSAPPASGTGGDLLSTLAVQQATDELNVLSGTQSCETMDSMKKAVQTIQTVSDTQCWNGGYREDGDCDQPTRDTSYTLSTLRTMYNSESAQSYSAKVLKAFNWLANIQKADGSFPDPNPFPSTYKEGPITTAYAAFCLLEAATVYKEVATKYASTIDRALNNIYDQTYNLDLLSLSYACRSFQLKGDSRRADILMRIEQKSYKSETSQVWFDDGMLDDALPHILESFDKEHKLIEAQRVGHSMTKRVVEMGDKIKPYQKGMMLKSLTRHHKKYSSLNPSIWIAVPDKNGASSLVLVNRTHKHVMRKIDVTTNKKNLFVANVGSGFANLDLTVEYNLKKEDVVDTYDMQVNMKPIGQQEWDMEVCAKCKDGHKPAASVMNIEFPPGFKTSDTIQDYAATTNKVKVSLELGFQPILYLCVSSAKN